MIRPPPLWALITVAVRALSVAAILIKWPWPWALLASTTFVFVLYTRDKNFNPPLSYARFIADLAILAAGFIAIRSIWGIGGLIVYLSLYFLGILIQMIERRKGL